MRSTFLLCLLSAPSLGMGCAREERAAPAIELPGFDSGAPSIDRDTSTTNVDSGTTAVMDSSSATPDSATGTDATSPPDLGPPPDVTVIDRCAAPYAAFGTKGLVAGGTTPKTFATAYNKEVEALAYPGPMLLAFKGVNETDGSKHKLRVGGLALFGTGPEVRFQGPTAEVNFEMNVGITLKVPDQLATFKLHFANDIPVVAIRVTATAGDCTEISVDSLMLLIPDTAKDIAFGGSTVGALMGTPIAPDAGAGPSVWPLELLGSDKKVTVGGGGP